MRGEINLLFGPQCSGKTTLAHSLFKGYKYVSLGEEVRLAPLSNKNKLLANILIEKSEEWPADLGLCFIKNNLTNNLKINCSVVLDGYPRHGGELRCLVSFLENYKLPRISRVFEVTAKKKVLVMRHKTRNRSGDNCNLFDHRYKQYLAFRKIIQSFCRQEGIDYYRLDTTNCG